jgi:thiol-disulfide isomerase/thioredoxin
LSEVIWVHSKEDLEKYIGFNGNRVVVRFTAEAWCVPCQRFAPHFERAAREADEITFLSVDLDTNDWATVDYGVRSVPTVKLYENGTFIRDIKAPQGALPFINDIRS